MNDLTAIEAQIRDAFASVTYPGDGCLCRSSEGMEPALLVEDFTGKRDWRRLDPAFLDRAPDGFGTALSFFSDQAFRFYLAAYLLADLRGELQQANVVFALTHGLDRASRDKKINPRRYGERTWFEHARDKFAMFSAPEVSAIVAYLSYKRRSNDVSDFQKAQIREALDDYWTARVA